MANSKNRTANSTRPGPLAAVGLTLAAGLLVALSLVVAIVIIIPAILLAATAPSAVRWLQSRKHRPSRRLVVIEGEYEVLNVTSGDD